MEKPPPEDPLQLVRFKDAVGRKFSFPFDMVKTWQVRELDSLVTWNFVI